MVGWVVRMGMRLMTVRLGCRATAGVISRWFSDILDQECSH